MLADQMRQMALAEGFNLIIEGTMQWSGQGPRLALELRGSGYEQLEIIAVEVPEDVAQRQAITRWWNGRLDPSLWGGGRFTPRQAIAAMYPAETAGYSTCLGRAVDAFNLPDVQALDHAILTVHNRHGIGRAFAQYEQVQGSYSHGIPDVRTLLEQ